MIAKVQTEKGWEFFDGISRAIQGECLGIAVSRSIDVCPAKEIGDQSKRGVHLFNTGLVESFWTNGEVYLLNDNGKTIERI